MLMVMLHPNKEHVLSHHCLYDYRCKRREIKINHKKNKAGTAYNSKEEFMPITCQIRTEEDYNGHDSLIEFKIIKSVSS